MASALVIGAGVSGFASAIALAEAGLEVRVLERHAVGCESSWAGAGILSLLSPWSYGAELTALADYSLRLWPQWLEKLQGGPDPEYRQCGMLVLDDENPHAAHAWLAQRGRAMAAVPESLGNLAVRNGSAIWLPEVAQVRNPRLLAALLHHAKRLGVEIIEHRQITRWEADVGHMTALHTDQGRMTADHFVVTAGAWSVSVLGEHAAGLSVFPVRGQILLLQSQPGAVPAIVLHGHRYLVPRADGLVLVGSTLEYTGFDKATTESARTDLLAFAHASFPALRDAPIMRQWAGLRPGSPDNIPTISRHPGIANLYANCGHFRYGVTLAPAAATLLADHILGRPPEISAAPYTWPETTQIS